MRLRGDGSGTEKIDEWLANRGPRMDSCTRKRTLASPRRHLHELRDHRRMIYRGCNDQAWKYSFEDFGVERVLQGSFNLCVEVH